MSLASGTVADNVSNMSVLASIPPAPVTVRCAHVRQILGRDPTAEGRDSRGLHTRSSPTGPAEHDEGGSLKYENTTLAT